MAKPDRERLRNAAQAMLGEVADGLTFQARIRELMLEVRTQRAELREQRVRLATTQAAVDEQRLRYSELFDFGPVGYLSLDRAGIIRTANLAAARMLDCERQRLIGV